MAGVLPSLEISACLIVGHVLIARTYVYHASESDKVSDFALVCDCQILDVVLNMKAISWPLFLLLGACATVTDAQREKQALYEKLTQVSRASLTCFDRLAGTSKYAPLYSKLAFSRAPATPGQLRDEQMISDEHLMLGLEWYAQNQVCDDLTLKGFSEVNPELGVTAAGWIQARTKMLNDVLTKRPTYGELNAVIEVHKAREGREVKSWFSKTNAQFAQRQSAELAEQERKSQEFKASASRAAETVMTGVIAAVAVLASQQAALAQAQRTYAATMPAYIYQPIRQTSCVSYSRGSLSCTHR